MSTQNPLSDVVVEHVAHRLLTLGQPVRIRIMQRLEQEGEMSVQAIVDTLDTTQQNVSRHLGLLYREGIVERRQEGRIVRYWLTGSDAMRLIEEAGDYVVRDMRTRGRPW